MTVIPEGWAEEGEGEGWEGTNEYAEAAVVPVRVTFNENERVSPEFAACVTWTVPVIGANLPIQVLQRQYHRYKSKFMATFPAPGTLYYNTKYEPLTNPSPTGFAVTIAGTAASAAVITPGVPATGVNVQNPNPYAVQVVINAAGAAITNVSVNGVTMGVAAGTYYVPAFGAISVAYTLGPPTWLWTNPAPVAATGGTIPLLEYDAEPAMWFIASIAGIQLSVIDELYGRVQ